MKNVSLGGFGERKFSGYTTSKVLKSPSRAHQTAIRLLAPLKLAKEASALHAKQDELANSDLGSPTSPLKTKQTLMIED